ncbi:MAG: pantetheine-phosphate adenylyltransferase [bacterium]|nr:pantetheine-phosphate adenylyltransferase [bacterium]
MKRAVYPGSFDPITNGHIDIIKRASKLFDELIVAVLVNPAKTPLFTVEERMELIRQSLNDMPNVKVDNFDGLLAHYAAKINADVIVRGLRAVSDFETEFQMALMNRRLNPDVEIVFLMTSYEYSYLSSGVVKEVVKLGGSVSGLVPECVETKLLEKVGRR